MQLSSLNKLRDDLFSHLDSDLIKELDPDTQKSFISKNAELKNLFNISDVIIRSGIDADTSKAISDEQLRQLYYYVAKPVGYADLFYQELIHYDLQTAVQLQAYLFISFQENSYLKDEEIALLMIAIYERLFGYDLQDIYETLQSMNPAEDDIDDYSNSTIEVYDSTDFSDSDEDFQTFLHAMIDCFEKLGFTTTEEN